MPNSITVTIFLKNREQLRFLASDEEFTSLHLAWQNFTQGATSNQVWVNKDPVTKFSQFIDLDQIIIIQGQG